LVRQPNGLGFVGQLDEAVVMASRVDDYNVARVIDGVSGVGIQRLLRVGQWYFRKRDIDLLSERN
jgi:hypothetical protein